MIDELIRKSHARIAAIDLSEGAVMLEADFGLRTLSAWMRHKFGIETTPDEFRDVEDRREVADIAVQASRRGLLAEGSRVSRADRTLSLHQKQGAQVSLDREGLVEWVARRFGVQLECRRRPAESRRTQEPTGRIQSQDGQRCRDSSTRRPKPKCDELFGSADSGTTAAVASGGNGSLDALAQWLEGELDYHAPKEDLSRMNRKELALAVDGAVDDRFHPEMRRMERQVLLQIVDDAWKNHLLTMDHLRSSVGLKGYAQMDPKVEYKREGMRLFESMWESIGERVTDLIFRMESSLNEDFIRSTWVEGQARHDEASTAAAQAPQSGGPSSDGGTSTSDPGEPAKPDPIRNRGPRVGRNDPCPCGSGKKYKSCHMRKKV